MGQRENVLLLVLASQLHNTAHLAPASESKEMDGECFFLPSLYASYIFKVSLRKLFFCVCVCVYVAMSI